jgi:hypothetical protein
MKKISLSFQVIAAIIAVTILQVCAGTATAATCATPTLHPATKTGASTVLVTIATTTTGAYLVYTLNDSEVGILIRRQSAQVTITVPKGGTTVLSAIAIKSGWRDSAAAVGTYRN